MKKLYRKGTVHPSPSPSPSPSPCPSPSVSISDQFSLAYLPAAILTLAAALSTEDKEVLAYLLSCSSAVSAPPFDFDPSKPRQHKKPNHHHPPSFTCYCFGCYTNYWARWDSSPNRQLIHEIIDAFEEGLLLNKKKKQGLSRREKRKGNNSKKGFDLDLDLNLTLNLNENGSDGSGGINPELVRLGSAEESGGQLGNSGGGDETGEKQGSVRKLVSFIGERIWGSVWG